MILWSVGMAEVIEYAGMPTRWQRWRGRLVAAGIVVSGHLVGIGATLLVLVGLPLILLAVVALFFVVMILSAGPGDDAPPPIIALAIPLILLVVGACTAAGVILAGIVVDAVRRALRWPWWSGAVGVAAILWLGIMVYQIVKGEIFAHAVMTGAMTSLVLTGLFCLYWIPMGCAEGILRLMKWGIQWLAGWWRRQRGVRI